MLLVLNDPPAAQRIVDVVKRVAPAVPVLMRTRYVKEVDALLALGAQDVVAEEVEGGLELLVRLLRVLETPRNVIEQRVKEAREATRTSERKLTMRRTTLGEVKALSGLKVDSVLLGDESPSLGRTVVELDLRRRTGAMVVALVRYGAVVQQNLSEQRFAAGDVVFLAGDGEALRKAMGLLARGELTAMDL